MELLLAESVPDLHLHPLVSTIDIVGRHRENLADPRGLLTLREFIEDTAVGERSFSNAAIADEDELVVVLTGRIF